MADDLALIIDPDLAFIAEVDGKPQGMCILLPNLNECIADLPDGARFPIGLKLLWRLKVSKRPPSRAAHAPRHPQGAARRAAVHALSAAMYVEVRARGVAKGYQWGELSWTREDDSPINSGIANMGAKIYKRYRVYERAL
jgi:hypothetical protein